MKKLRTRRFLRNRRRYQGQPAVSRSAEILEDRTLLSFSVELQEGTLIVLGDKQDNQIEINELEDGVEVICDGESQTFEGDIAGLFVDTDEGDDSLVVNFAEAGTRILSFEAHLGKGKDKLVHSLYGIRDAETEAVDISAFAGDGDDELTVRYGAPEGTDGHYYLNAPLNVSLDGEEGHDFIVTQITHSAAKAPVSIHAAGGSHSDQIEILYSDVRFDAGHEVRLFGDQAEQNRHKDGDDSIRLIYENVRFTENSSISMLSNGGGADDEMVTIFDNVSVEGFVDPDLELPRNWETVDMLGNNTIAFLHQHFEMSSPIVATTTTGNGSDTIINAFTGGGIHAEHDFSIQTGRGDDFVFHFDTGVAVSAQNRFSFDTDRGDDEVVVLGGADVSLNTLLRRHPDNSHARSATERILGFIEQDNLYRSFFFPSPNLPGSDLPGDDQLPPPETDAPVAGGVTSLKLETDQGEDGIIAILIGLLHDLEISIDSGAQSDTLNFEYDSRGNLIGVPGNGGLDDPPVFPVPDLEASIQLGGSADIANINVRSIDPDVHFELDSGQNDDLVTTNFDLPNPGGPLEAIGPQEDIITGLSTRLVKVFDGMTAEELQFFIAQFGGLDSIFSSAVRVAAGDVNGDGFDDIIVGSASTDPEPGPNPQFISGFANVLVFDGINGSVINSFSAFDPGPTNGVYVAAGDINNDGFDEIITGTGGGSAQGPGGGPHVRVFDGSTGALLESFFAYDPSFSGAVRVAVGDVNNDGTPDIITGAGPGAGPHVKVFDGNDQSELLSFFAFDPGFAGGIYVAAGDINADGFDDIITGAGAGAGPHVRVFSGATGQLHRDFIPYPGFTGGVRVAAGDVNADGFDDIITGAGFGLPQDDKQVKVFSGADHSLLQQFFPFGEGPFNATDVYVAAGNVNSQRRLHVIEYQLASGDDDLSFSMSTANGVDFIAELGSGSDRSKIDINSPVLQKVRETPIRLALDLGSGLNSADVSIRNGDPHVNITGGNHADAVDLDLRSTVEQKVRELPPSLKIDLKGGNDDLNVFSRGLDHIESDISTGGGSDQVIARLLLPAEQKVRETAARANLSVDLGNGTNDLVAHVRGFDEVDSFVQGGNGTDSVLVRLLLPAVQKVREAAARSTVDLGNGENDLRVNVRGYDEVQSVVEGGRDADSILIGLLLPAEQKVREVATAWSEVNLGNGSNDLRVNVNGFDEVDSLVDAGNGTDSILIGLLLPAVQKVREAAARSTVNLGNGENDLRFNVNGYNEVNSFIQGGRNKDSLRIGLLLPAVQKVRDAAIKSAMHLGGGDDSAIAHVLFSSLSESLIADVGFDLGSGDDRLVWRFLSEADQTELKLQVDAGRGSDELIGRTFVPANPSAFTADVGIDLGLGDNSLLFNVFTTPGPSEDSTIEPTVGLTEVLASIFITGVGQLSLLTLFPAGIVEMAQAIQDDRAGDTSAGNTLRVTANGISEFTATIEGTRRDDDITMRLNDVEHARIYGDLGRGNDRVREILQKVRESDDDNPSTLELDWDLGSGENYALARATGYDQVDAIITSVSDADAVLIGLLLPAVQKVRDSAARVIVDMGHGANVLRLNVNGYDEVDSYIQGGRNDDSVRINLLQAVEQKVRSAAARSMVDLGNGDNDLRFRVNGFDNVDAAVWGGNGTDYWVFGTELPAVQKVREAANVNVDLNTLAGNDTVHFLLLPYIEQDNLFVRADLGIGDDIFTAQLLGAAGGSPGFDIAGAPFNHKHAGHLQLDVQGSRGNDDIRLRFGSTGASDVPGSDLSQAVLPDSNIVNIGAGKGDDAVRVIYDNVTINGTLEQKVSGDDGNDSMRLIWRDVGVNGNVYSNWQGGRGDDWMLFNARGGHIGPGASARFIMAGGRHDDTLLVRINDLLLDGKLGLNLAGNKGNDHLDARIHLDPESEGSLCVEVDGDKGHDELVLKVFGTDGLKDLFALLDGGSGCDTCLVTPNVSHINCED